MLLLFIVFMLLRLCLRLIYAGTCLFDLLYSVDLQFSVLLIVVWFLQLLCFLFVEFNSKLPLFMIFLR